MTFLNCLYKELQTLDFLKELDTISISTTKIISITKYYCKFKFTIVN